MRAVTIDIVMMLQLYYFAAISRYMYQFAVYTV